jgi:hypothetical protein
VCAIAVSLEPKPMPRGPAVAMTSLILGLVAGVFMLLALFAWQPWDESTSRGGIQGGGDSTPVPGQTVPPAPP